ncbi:3792_t:CDS:2, partial [Racocetra persica]
MCIKVTCQTCGKYTWAGCGRHADAVMSQIPKEDHCICKRNTQADSSSGSDIKDGRQSPNTEREHFCWDCRE